MSNFVYCEQLWPKLTRASRRPPDQSSARTITTSTNRAASWMCMDKWHRCTCDTSRSSSRQSNRSALGQLSTPYARTGRRTETSPLRNSTRSISCMRKNVLSTLPLQHPANLKKSESSNTRLGCHSPSWRPRTHSFSSSVMS